MKELWDLLVEQRAFFLGLVEEHLLIAGVAIGIALVVGGALGLVMTRRHRIAPFILSVVNILYTVPSIALLGILIAVTGIGNVTAIVALTLYALLPMVRSTYTGLVGVDAMLLEAAEGMGSTPSQVLRKIQFPLAFPVIMSGIRNMVTMTIAMAGIASFVGAGGLGVAIYRGIATNNQEMTLAGSLLVALLAIVLDWLLALIEKRVKERKKFGKFPLVAGIIFLVGLLFFTFFQQSGSRGTIHIATKPQTENYILGEMQRLVIEDTTNLTVKMTKGVGGGTANIHPAMVKGDFDLYAEYTGTVWETILKKEGLYDESQFETLAKEYEAEDGLVWASQFGFNNTYGLAVSKEIADRYQLKTYSDLAKVSDQLRFGAEYDFFGREDGFDRLVDRYGMYFKEELDMDSGLKYQAIQNKQVDVINIFTTDAQLAVSDVVVLEDDKGLYPSYQAGTVVRKETLEKYPELGRALKKLDHILDDQTMSALNARVENGKEDPTDVARDFLKEKGILQ